MKTKSNMKVVNNVNEKYLELLDNLKLKGVVNTERFIVSIPISEVIRNDVLRRVWFNGTDFCRLMRELLTITEDDKIINFIHDNMTNIVPNYDKR